MQALNGKLNPMRIFRVRQEVAGRGNITVVLQEGSISNLDHKTQIAGASVYHSWIIWAGAITVCLFAISACSNAEEEAALAAQAALELQQAEEAARLVADSIQRVNDSIAAREVEIAESLATAEEMPPHPSLEIQWGTYTVQIGSYDSRELATPFYNKLVAEGLDPYILDELALINGEERIVYRLRFGKYGSKDEAHNRGSEVALRHELDYWVDNFKR